MGFNFPDYAFVDAHVHLVITPKGDSILNSMANFNAYRYRSRDFVEDDIIIRNWCKVVRNESMQPSKIEELQQGWISSMNRSNIEHIVLMGHYPQTRCWLNHQIGVERERDPHYAEKLESLSDCTEMIQFIAGSKRFIGTACVNPNIEDATTYLLQDLEAGLQGVKFYPGYYLHHMNSNKTRNVLLALEKYQEEQKIKQPVYCHLGISEGQNSRIRYRRTDALSEVAADFPLLNFVIPHFGAGLMTDILILGSEYKNIYIDTSGLNGWVKVVPELSPGLDSRQMAFETAISRFFEVYGPRRIVFGTDTGRIFNPLYRDEVVKMQYTSLLKLGVSYEDTKLVMRENALRLFGKL